MFPEANPLGSVAVDLQQIKRGVATRLEVAEGQFSIGSVVCTDGNGTLSIPVPSSGRRELVGGVASDGDVHAAGRALGSVSALRLDMTAQQVPGSTVQGLETRVRGCASQVWMVTNLEDQRLTVRAESDAIIVSGLIALLTRLYSGEPAADILGFDARRLLDDIGVTGALTAQRSNGLASMLARIEGDARVAAQA
jgi:sulfur transfer protein SufE